MEYRETQRSSEQADSKPGSVVLVKSTELDHIPVISKSYLNLSIKKKNKQVDKWIKENVEKIKEKCSNHEWKNSPVFEGYIELHDRHTAKKGIPSSSAALIDFILEKGSVPRINTFVDIYNVISSYTGISIGAHDIDKLEGTPRLEIITRDTPFKMIGGIRDEVARKGEFGYVDDIGIMCRMDIKQCERTKVTENTKRVLMIFQGHAYIQNDDLEKGIQMLDDAILNTPYVQH